MKDLVNGNIEIENVQCDMATRSNAVTMGWACDRVDCKAYGNYCPFSW